MNPIDILTSETTTAVANGIALATAFVAVAIFLWTQIPRGMVFFSKNWRQLRLAKMLSLLRKGRSYQNNSKLLIVVVVRKIYAGAITVFALILSGILYFTGNANIWKLPQVKVTEFVSFFILVVWILAVMLLILSNDIYRNVILYANFEKKRKNIIKEYLRMRGRR